MSPDTEGTLYPLQRGGGGLLTNVGPKGKKQNRRSWGCCGERHHQLPVCVRGLKGYNAQLKIWWNGHTHTHTHEGTWQMTEIARINKALANHAES